MKDEIDINQQVISLYSHLRKEFDQINISQNLFFPVNSFQNFSHTSFILIENASCAIYGKAAFIVTLLYWRIRAQITYKSAARLLKCLGSDCILLQLLLRDG